MLFLLRGVDHTDLVGADAAQAITGKAARGRRLDDASVAGVFGIEVEAAQAPPAAPKKVKKRKKNAKR